MAQPVRILYIDDDDLGLVRDVLQSLGESYHVTIAASRTALETHLARDKYDVAVTDFNIFGLADLEILEIMHTYQPALPVIIVTASGSEAIAVAAMKRGASDYLVKTPDQIQRLPAAIHATLPSPVSLHLMAQVVAASRDSIVISNPQLPDNPVIYCNAAFEQMTGYTQAEIIGRNCRFMQGPDTEAAALAAIRQGLREQRACHVTLTNYRKDGSTFLNDLYIDPIVDDTGTVTHYVGRQNDVTAYKQAEDALRNNEERLQRIVQHMPVMMDAFDKEGNIVAWNAECERVTGYRSEEVISNPDIMDRLYPDPAFLRQMLTKWQQRGDDYREWEWKMVAKDGSFKIIAWSNISKHMPISGWDTWGIGVDVTERKQIEEAMRQSEQRYRRLARIAARLNQQRNLDHTLRVICEEVSEAITLPVACIRLYDEQSDMMLLAGEVGMPRTFMVRQQPQPRAVFEHLLQHETLLVVPDIQELSDLPNSDALMEANIRTVCHVAIRREDELIGVLFVASIDTVYPVTDDDCVLLQAIVDQATQAIHSARLAEQDRTVLERRVTEATVDLQRLNTQLERAAVLKDQFLAGMSHELRTPLNAVLGYAEALQEQTRGPLNERQNRAVARIEESGRHLLTLINDILDIAKVEAGALELDITNVAVSSICDASLRLVNETARKKQLTVSSKIDNSVKTVWADARRIKQVLVNLLSNAVKFTPEQGTIGLDVTGNSTEGVVRFSVWDTGIGIPKNAQERLFQPFVQLDSSLDRQYTGTGLGLALVARMVDLHGGSVIVESKLGVGSRFTVSLPWLSPKAANDASAQPDLPEREPMDLPLRIGTALLIEDEAAPIDQLTRYLEEIGTTIVVHKQGNGAVEQAKRLQPDVIVLDIQLPDISGWDILLQLKAQTETVAIPVIVVSIVDERMRSIGYGATDHLVKPITRAQLQRALRMISVPPQAPPSPVPDAPAPTPSADAPLILLAEDNETNIEMLQDFLEELDYRMAIARNGHEALTYARNHCPDIVLMDIQMPGLDGLEAIRRMRAEPTLAHIPIIAITALAMPGDHKRCLAAGANEYIAKPIKLIHLRHTIETYMRDRKEPSHA